MCYHSTYLFSLCGHTAISDHPVRHIASCPNVSTASTQRTEAPCTTPDRSRAASPPLLSIPMSASYHQGIVSEPMSYNINNGADSVFDQFPSPQEFEFTKQLHNSLPVSPVSPITIGEQWYSEAGRAGANTSSVNNHVMQLLPSDRAYHAPSHCITPLPRQAKVVCQTVTRHPLKTYVIPQLCRPCWTRREINIARFEASVIRENLQREERGSPFDSVSGRERVVDMERKKISRRNVRDGAGLIPLICVEEGRIRKLVHESGKDTLQTEASQQADEEAKSQVGVDGDINNVVQEDMQAEPTADGESVVRTQREKRQLRHMSTSSSVMTSSSGWSSWWERGTAAAAAVGKRLPSSPQVPPRQLPSPPLTPPLTAATVVEPPHEKQGSFTTNNIQPKPLGAAIRKETQPAETLAPSSKLDQSDMQGRWKGINSNVARDLFGRNVSGMNRIMGWDDGGMASGVDNNRASA